MIRDSKYQLILLGNIKPFKKLLLREFYFQVDELGLDRKLISIIYGADFNSLYDVTSPTVVIYFGGEEEESDENLLQKLKNDSALIIPVYSFDKDYKDQVPEILYPLNGARFEIKQDFNKIVNIILEGVGLLRIARRLFISYKRNESSGVAIQLYEALEKAGFDVFLDTHSIKPGDHFQDELWHRFSDTDIAVILNTPKFLESNWTSQELAKANSMGISIVQLIWPEHQPDRGTELMTPMFLSHKHFKSGTFDTQRSVLKRKVVKEFTWLVESMRARSLASRRDTIITEFFSSAKKFEVEADLQPHKFITIKNSKDVIIPSVGVPDAFTYNQSAELVKEIRKENIDSIWLLYDNRHVQEKWLEHLSWLDEHLPIKSIKITEVEEWLMKNKI